MNQNILLFKRILISSLVSLLCLPAIANAIDLDNKSKAKNNNGIKLMSRRKRDNGDSSREERVEQRRQEREQQQQERQERQEQVQERQERREEAQQERAEQRQEQVQERQEEREQHQQDRWEQEQHRQEQVQERQERREEAQQERNDSVYPDNSYENGGYELPTDHRTVEEIRQEQIRQRAAERARAQAERERRAEAARQAEIRRQQRLQESRDRLRQRNEIRREQRRQARRNDRLRDPVRQDHRRNSRQRYEEHARENRRHRRAIRRHDRWQFRYDSWINAHDRWDRPQWPEEVIDYPGQWPEDMEIYWSITEVIDVSDNIEAQFAYNYDQLYDLGYGKEKLGDLAYELWHASQVYSDAIEFYNTNLYYSIYELFYLEKALLEFEEELKKHSGVDNVLKHLEIGKFYINELLWQYRQQVGPIDEWKNKIDEGDEWRSQASSEWDDVDSNANFGYFYFWWTKEHRVADWSLAQATQINSISIEAPNTLGRRGKNGVVGITNFILIYEDGSQYNLVTKDHDSYTRKSKQLVLRDEGQLIEVYNPHPNKLVKSIQIKADSWVAPDVDVEILVNLNTNRTSKANFVELL